MKNETKKTIVVGSSRLKSILGLAFLRKLGIVGPSVIKNDPPISAYERKRLEEGRSP